MKIIKPENINPEIREKIEKGIAPDSTIAQLLMTGSIAYEGKTYDHYSPVYRQANEPFESYLKRSDIEGKEVLTVNGSGDFLTWILQNDPASISTFDVNIFTDYYQSLKIGGLLALRYEEYLNFFYGNDAFNYISLDKILNVLPENTRKFWSSLTDFFESNEIVSSELFVQDVVTIANAKAYNSFLRDEESYLKAKKAALKLSYAFHNLPFNKLYETKKKFDTIFVSNIIDYQNYTSIFNAIYRLRSTLATNLKDDGVIIGSTIGPKVMPNFIGELATIRKASDSIYELRVKPCKH